MKNDFIKARLHLVLLYLLIIGSVIALFSLLIIYQANDSFSDPAVQTDELLLLNADEATGIAQKLYPDEDIEETEYEIENGTLYYTVTFEDENEVKVNLFTGEPYVPEQNGSLLEMVTDDFDEMVGWIALLVFIFAATLCVHVANRTLDPIANNIRKQKQFISGAAHELRNPLAALHSRIESVLRSPQKELKEEVLGDLLSETKHLITVSEDLLALERGEHKTPVLKAQSLQEIAGVVIKRLKHFGDTKNISLETDIDAETLYADRDDIEALFYNLVHNAIKFTPEHGKVNIAWANKTLTVIDTGIGIPKDAIPHVFDRFYKGDMSRKSMGSGLGLSLVKEIVDRYKATITVESVGGHGTTVTVKFK